MVKSIVLFLGVVGAVTIASQEAAATKRCAPLPVQNTGGPICKCSVQNYSTVADAGVKIEVYAENGGITTCGPSTVDAKTATSCRVSILAGTSCGCVVTGEGSLTRASLSATDGTTEAAQASLECH